MRWKGLTVLIMLLLGACAGGGGGGGPMERPATGDMNLLDGTDPAAVSIERTAAWTEISFRPGPAGAFVDIAAPFDNSEFSEVWQGDEHTVHLVVPVDGRLHIGVAPAAGYAGSEVRLRLAAGGSGRSTSTPPTKEINKVDDLLATDLGNGQVKLDWTQINWADYDLNGEVNISDLTPIAQYFGATGSWTKTDPEYWVDGDQNGVINISDVTPIAQNYQISVGGYNIYRNGVKFPQLGSGPGTVDSSFATQGGGLPARYGVVLDSPADGSFTVAPVDYDGVEGIMSFPSMLSLPSLNVDLSIIGQQLFDQNTGQPSDFTSDTVILRVIDPIKEVNSAEFGTVLPLTNDGTFTVNGLPREMLLHLQVAYVPTVDLGTGSPKGGSMVRGTSAIPNDAVITAIPFRLPAGSDPGSVNALIDLGTSNPGGGFFVDLANDLTLPGDNPATPVVEDGWTRTEDIRLDYVGGLTTLDTDANGDFDDEPHLEDANKDCVSDQRREQELDDDEYENRDEIEVEGDVVSFDEEAGSVTLTNVEVTIGEIETDVNGEVTLFFSELSNFEERIRTDANPDGEPFLDFDPSTIMPGDKLEIDLYALEDTQLLIPTVYWTEKVKRVIDNRT